MSLAPFCASVATAAKPNIVLIYTDDQGYNDLGCFGSKLIKTPRIDRMAREGVKLTSFYSAAGLCGPSRAAVMTGCYSQRVAELGGRKHWHTILHPSEVTIAEVLKDAGYHTLALGKWHLAGSQGSAIGTDKKKTGLDQFFAMNPKLMPTAQGFDEYFGIPYSNDMMPSVLMRDEAFIESPVEQRTITKRYTDEAIRFIGEHKDEPFFVYLAHTMPHTPLWTEKQFEGQSAYGYYGDCIEEIDFHTGRLLDEVKRLGLDEKTLVIFTSDNGPWLEPPKRVPAAKGSRLQSGTAAPLRGAKMTCWDGGFRVPCVMRWPGKLPAGVTEKRVVSTIDLLPTFAAMAGATLPADRVIDGRDATQLLTGKSDAPLREAFYFYKHNHLLAVRSSKWKVALPRPARPGDLGWYGRLQEAVAEPQLFDLDADIGEQRDVAAEHPKVLLRMLRYAEQARNDLGDRGRNAKGARRP
ncbi:MAG: sulfatase [Pirellulales bacterium]|nr:sulfatase [Pirellulales bacterium]